MGRKIHIHTRSQFTSSPVEMCWDMDTIINHETTPALRFVIVTFIK